MALSKLILSPFRLWKSWMTIGLNGEQKHGIICAGLCRFGLLCDKCDLHPLGTFGLAMAYLQAQKYICYMFVICICLSVC